MDCVKLDVQNICRVCMKHSPNNLFPIFGCTNNSAQILMCFVQVCENDGLPSQICTQCFEMASTVRLFKQLCEKSDTMFRKYLQTSACDLHRTQQQLSTFSELQQFLKPDIIPKEKLDETNLKVLEQNPFVEVASCESNPIHPASDDEKPTVRFAIEVAAVSIDQKGCAAKSYVELSLPLAKAKSKIIKCNMCDEKFEKKICLRRHIATDHSDDPNLPKSFECIECKKTYSTVALLQLHMKIHSDKVYNCEQCPKKFPRLDMYLEHAKRHSGERTFLCTKCGKGFFNQIYLQRHMQIHRNDHLEKPTFECPICGKILKHSNHLQVHMKTHQDRTEPMNGPNRNSSTKQLNLCSVCGKSCSSTSNLAVHMRRHTGKMTNFCQICGKGYPRTTDLTLHMRRHTGEKPFVCHICERRFARSDKLAIHMRTHTGERPYLCNMCGKAFAQSNDLASHKRRNLCTDTMPSITSVHSVALTQQQPQHQFPISSTGHPHQQNANANIPARIDEHNGHFKTEKQSVSLAAVNGPCSVPTIVQPMQTLTATAVDYSSGFLQGYSASGTLR